MCFRSCDCDGNTVLSVEPISLEMFFLMVKIVFLKTKTWMQIVITDFVSCGFVCKIHSFETSENWQDTTYVLQVKRDK